VLEEIRPDELKDMNVDIIERMGLDVVEKMGLDVFRGDELRRSREDEPRRGREDESRCGREDEREIFFNSRQNRTRRLVCPRRLRAFNAPIPFLEIPPRVGLGLVVCAANNCRSS
jgi:hypothetical protein